MPSTRRIDTNVGAIAYFGVRTMGSSSLAFGCILAALIVMPATGHGQGAGVRTVGTDHLDIFIGACATSDGGVVVSFTEADTVASQSDTRVVRLAADRSVVWSRTFDNSPYDQAGPILELEDGRLVMTCFLAYGIHPSSTHIVFMNAAGEVDSSKCVGRLNVWDMCRSSDGGFILWGVDMIITLEGGSGYSTPGITLLDAQGDRIWARGFDPGGASSARACVPTDDGGVVFSASMSQQGENGYAALLGKLDANGDLAWMRKWDGPDADALMTICKDNDGGYFAAGTVHSGGMAVVRTDADGMLLWQREYPGTRSARDMVRDANGDLIIFTRSWEAQPQLWRLTSEGIPVEHVSFVDNVSSLLYDHVITAGSAGNYSLFGSIEQESLDIAVFDLQTPAGGCTLGVQGGGVVDLAVEDTAVTWPFEEVAFDTMVTITSSLTEMSIMDLCAPTLLQALQGSSKSALKILPTLADQFVDVIVPEGWPSQSRMSIYSASGSLIRKEAFGGPSERIDIPDLATGVYCMKIEALGSRSVQGTFVKR